MTNWYTLPADERFPAAVAKCIELMTQEEWEDFVRDAPAGGLLQAMEDFILEHEAE